MSDQARLLPPEPITAEQAADFRKAVREMRAAQKGYYAARKAGRAEDAHAYLNESFRLETFVDGLLRVMPHE